VQDWVSIVTDLYGGPSSSTHWSIAVQCDVKPPRGFFPCVNNVFMSPMFACKPCCNFFVAFDLKMESKTTKPYATATQVNHDGRQTSSNMRGRSKDILLAFFALTVPMVALSAALLALIYHYRIVRNDFISSNLRLDTGQDNSKVVYVKFSATSLTQVASWSSTLAPILVGFTITLISYPVARSILLAGEENDPRALPTPYQFYLMLRMVANGSPVSLWHWITYTAKGRREKQGKPLKTMTWILFLSVILR
jgi:hypothetical protein